MVSTWIKKFYCSSFSKRWTRRDEVKERRIVVEILIAFCEFESWIYCVYSLLLRKQARERWIISLICHFVYCSHLKLMTKWLCFGENSDTNEKKKNLFCSAFSCFCFYFSGISERFFPCACFCAYIGAIRWAEMTLFSKTIMWRVAVWDNQNRQNETTTWQLFIYAHTMAHGKEHRKSGPVETVKWVQRENRCLEQTGDKKIPENGKRIE